MKSCLPNCSGELGIVLRNNFCKNQYVFTVKLKASNSWGWKGIMSRWNTILTRAKWRVRNYKKSLHAILTQQWKKMDWHVPQGGQLTKWINLEHKKLVFISPRSELICNLWIQELNPKLAQVVSHYAIPKFLKQIPLVNNLTPYIS